MKPNSILYYPHIEFQNEAWVKSSLLLWDHVYRIVPEGYSPNDSDEIKALVDEDLVRDIKLLFFCKTLFFFCEVNKVCKWHIDCCFIYNY